MESILNVQVSCFEEYSKADNPKTVNLLKWLTSTKYADKVNEIRAVADKEKRDKLKAKLPAITPSGVFSYRLQTCLIKYSGFVQFDIDLKDNLHIANFAQLKEQLMKIPNVAYCGLSVSGTGYWGLIPVAYPEKHQQHFKAIQKAFAIYNIKIDPAPCSVASLRGYSYDAEAYFNHNATVLEVYLEDSQNISAFSTVCTGAESELVEMYLQKIEVKKLDITSDYKEWFNLGCALADTFGEAGRGYYHRFSQFYLNYSVQEVDAKYDECLKHREYSYHFGTLVYYCQQAGLKGSYTLSETEASNVKPGSVSFITPAEQKLQEVSIAYPVATTLVEALELDLFGTVEQLPELLELIPEQQGEAVQHLVEFYKRATIPEGPVQLDKATTIVQPEQFVQRHLQYLQGAGKWKFKEPYFERLQKLRELLPAVEI